MVGACSGGDYAGIISQRTSRLLQSLPPNPSRPKGACAPEPSIAPMPTIPRGDDRLAATTDELLLAIRLRFYGNRHGLSQPPSAALASVLP